MSEQLPEPQPLTGTLGTRFLWLFLVLAIPALIIAAFWSNGYLGF